MSWIWEVNLYPFMSFMDILWLTNYFWKIPINLFKSHSQEYNTPLAYTYRQHAPSNNFSLRITSHQSGNNKNCPTCQICSYLNNTNFTYRRRYQKEQPNGNINPRPNANVVVHQPDSSMHVTWYPDIAANYHISPNTQKMTQINEYTGPDQLYGMGKVWQFLNSLLSSSDNSFIMNKIYVFLPSRNIC